MSRFKRHDMPLAVDISQNAIKVLWPDGTTKSPSIRALLHIPLPSNAVKDGRLVSEVAGKILGDALAHAGIKAKHAVTAITSAGSISKAIRIPSGLTEGEQEDHISIDAPNLIPGEIKAVTDFMVLSDDDKGAGTLPCILSAARQDTVAEVVDTLESAGLMVDMVGLQSHAAAEVARTAAMPGRVALLDLGSTAINLYLLEGSRIIQEKEASSNLSQLVVSLRTAAGLSSDADAMRALAHGDLPSGFVEEHLDTFRESLAQQVVRLIQAVMDDMNHEAIARIILTGGGALIQNLSSTVQDMIGIPTEIGDPFKAWSVPAATAQSITRQRGLVNPATLWILAGLGWWALEDRATSGQVVNFIGWRTVRRARRQRDFLAGLAMAAAAGIAIMVMDTMTLHSRIATQQATNDYLQAQIKQADAGIQAIKHLTRDREDLLARKRVVDDLQAERAQMVHVWSELASTRPAGIRLTLLKQKGKDLLIEGAARNAVSVSRYLRNLERGGWIRSPNLDIILAPTAPAAAGKSSWASAGFPLTFSVQVQMHNPDASLNAVSATTQLSGIEQGAGK